ncbi:hypothetical protein BS50DRAFT_623786 [Corynespora cassiicola Philippines]|uniref:Uncharacterized protein n=1 Tax=Corynespora cassiicola Philippines TaxID=1448308 RepID=A0A2T2NFN2_CORCC|nr:hypothetical protein BS50DRAFT_623786 [Corynespora cassiicola Philippines]
MQKRPEDIFRVAGFFVRPSSQGQHEKECTHRYELSQRRMTAIRKYTRGQGYKGVRTHHGRGAAGGKNALETVWGINEATVAQVLINANRQYDGYAAGPDDDAALAASCDHTTTSGRSGHVDIDKKATVAIRLAMPLVGACAASTTRACTQLSAPPTPCHPLSQSKLKKLPRIPSHYEQPLAEPSISVQMLPLGGVTTGSTRSGRVDHDGSPSVESLDRFRKAQHWALNDAPTSVSSRISHVIVSAPVHDSSPSAANKVLTYPRFRTVSAYLETSPTHQLH